MLISRHCSATNQEGQPCGQAPLREREFCFWHDPEQAEAATEARRLGGQRRKRESTLAGAYDFEGFRGPDDFMRVLEIATFDTLSLENSVARARTLIAVAQAGQKLYETTELASRLTVLEGILGARGEGRKS